MTDDEAAKAMAEMRALDDARAEIDEAIAALTPTAVKELAEIASDHIRKCYGDFDAARKIWDAAFAEAERIIKEKMNEEP